MAGAKLRPLCRASGSIPTAKRSPGRLQKESRAVPRSNVLMNAEFVNSREHGTMNLGPVKCGEARYEAGWKTSWRKIAWEIAEGKDLQDVSMRFYENCVLLETLASFRWKGSRQPRASGIAYLNSRPHLVSRDTTNLCTVASSRRESWPLAVLAPLRARWLLAGKRR